MKKFYSIEGSGTTQDGLQSSKTNKCKLGSSYLCDLTDKELRQGHNLEKLYRAGAFN